MSIEPYPISWIRLREGSPQGAIPAEAGVYLRAADVAGWLRFNALDDLAELLDDESQWPATDTRKVGTW